MDYSRANNNVTVDLSKNRHTGSLFRWFNNCKDTFKNIQNVIGSNNKDIIAGNSKTIHFFWWLGRWYIYRKWWRWYIKWWWWYRCCKLCKCNWKFQYCFELLSVSIGTGPMVQILLLVLKVLLEEVEMTRLKEQVVRMF